MSPAADTRAPAARAGAGEGREVEVRPVRGRRERDLFVKLPFRLREQDPLWTPPLISERKRFLDKRRNPWFDHGEAELFLAWREGEPVGRISAHIDRRWDEFQGGNDGMFGFVDFVDDPGVAAALIDAASQWLSERGRERMLGPMDFTMNDECGVLFEGFDQETVILAPWHPPHYHRHLSDACGLGKAMDLLMWRLEFGALHSGVQFHPSIHEAAEKALAEHGITIRSMRRADMEAEVHRFMEVYNEAWGRNWGFVPVTEAEVANQAKMLKPILDESWAMIAEREGEVVGAALTLPNIDVALKPMAGRLLPLGWAKFLWHRRKINWVRIFALGVKHEYRHTGTAAAFYIRHLKNAAEGLADGGEAGWILETNEAMNRALEGMGGRVTKRYRIYERSLGPAGP